MVAKKEIQIHFISFHDQLADGCEERDSDSDSCWGWLSFCMRHRRFDSITNTKVNSTLTITIQKIIQ
jgi:hypothetical protein